MSERSTQGDRSWLILVGGFVLLGIVNLLFNTDGYAPLKADDPMSGSSLPWCTNELPGKR